MRQKRIHGTSRKFIDKQGRQIALSFKKDHVYASHDKVIIAALFLIYEPDRQEWRAQRAWIEQEEFHRSGIGAALYDYAFRVGFRPLHRSRTQTTAGAAFWRKYINERQFPDREHWQLANPPAK
jgi:hypothetical protein